MSRWLHALRAHQSTAAVHACERHTAVAKYPRIFVVRRSVTRGPGKTRCYYCYYFSSGPSSSPMPKCLSPKPDLLASLFPQTPLKRTYSFLTIFSARSILLFNVEYKIHGEQKKKNNARFVRQ